MKSRFSLEFKFWKRVEIGEPFDCWKWNGCKTDKGYGIIYFDGKWRKAHRMSWIIAYPEKVITDDLEVCHKCDNRACVNPRHLFLGTHKQNIEDMDRKGRRGVALGIKNGSHTKPEKRRRGSIHGMAKITESDVLEIRSSVGISQRRLAKQYGISQPMVGFILRRENWKHV